MVQFLLLSGTDTAGVGGQFLLLSGVVLAAFFVQFLLFSGIDSAGVGGQCSIISLVQFYFISGAVFATFR